MIYDQPDLCELDMMFHFCSLYKDIFIYGCEEKQAMLNRYMGQAGRKIAGFVISKRGHWETFLDERPIYTLDELEHLGYSKDGTGFLLALPDKYYNEVLCGLQRRGYKNVFYMSEYNKNTIAYKMRARKKEQFWLEVNLADHCNLDCQMCDHYSPLAEHNLLGPTEYRRDMERLAYLMDSKMGIMKLQGGEPLLNRNAGKIIRITRDLFPGTRIWLFTNGLLLLQSEYWEEGNLWECMHDNGVEVQLTVYPIHMDYRKIRQKADEYDVKLMMFKEAANRDENIIVKTSVKHPHDLKGMQDKYSFISCYQFNESIVLRNGKIYTCPMIPYSSFLEKEFSVEFERSREDGIDIYSAESYEDIAEFVTKRTPFCRYCDVRHRQFGIEWKQSTHSLEEYV